MLVLGLAVCVGMSAVGCGGNKDKDKKDKDTAAAKDKDTNKDKAGTGTGDKAKITAVKPKETAVKVKQEDKTEVEVNITRADGYKDAVTIKASDLPAGVTAADVAIPAEKTTGTLVLVASKDAAPVADKEITLSADGHKDATSKLKVTVEKK